jgi:uncharacterized protein (DUF58 family)
MNRRLSGGFLDPVDLGRIADLQLIARTVVAGAHTGIHRSLHTGTSAEFAQYRSYAQGDDTRSVDWHLFARSDRLYVKQYHEEHSLRSTILLDCSASMSYVSGDLTKFRYAQMLAGCLAMLLINQHDAVGLGVYQDELKSYLPARRRPAHLRRILTEIEQAEPSGTTDPAATLRTMGDILPARGMVILISDLLHPIEAVEEHLRSLRARRHDVIVLQISDPAEQTFPFDRATTFVDAETGDERFTVPDTVRTAYLENRQTHFDRVAEVCADAEIHHEEWTTTEPLDLALTSFVHRRNRAVHTTNRPRSAV